MDPSTFFGAALGAFLATAIPAHAGVVCNRQGFCVAQPQFSQPYYPPPVVIRQAPPPYYPSPPIQPPPPKDELGLEVKQEILAFCQQHPDEHFCGTLEAYLQKHPNAR